MIGVVVGVGTGASSPSIFYVDHATLNLVHIWL